MGFLNMVFMGADHVLFASLLLHALYSLQATSALAESRFNLREVHRELLQDDSTPDLEFSVSKLILEQQLDSKPYRNVVEVTHLDECVAYFDDVWPESCKPGNLDYNNLDVCCGALRNLADVGLCVCEAQINRGLVAYGVNRFATMGAFCGVKFPIPKDERILLEEPYSLSEECQVYESASINGKLSPDFLDMPLEALKQPNPDLPDFEDLYRPLEPGPFHVNYEIIDVPRVDPSIIVNSFSSEMSFKALVVYPVDAIPMENKADGIRRKLQQPMSARGPFPLMVFSPGFGISPTNHIRTFYQLASHGMIVAAQYSTQQILLDVTEDVMHAWVDDIVYTAKHITEENNVRGSIFGNNVDTGKLIIAGHSMGGGLSLPATVQSKEKYDLDVKVTVSISPACKLRAKECDLATEGAENLRDVDVLFITGDEDRVEKPEYAEFFKSVVPDQSAADLVVIEGANHCFWEAAPSTWPQTVGCGNGSKSPFKSIVEMQEVIVGYLAERNFFPK